MASNDYTPVDVPKKKQEKAIRPKQNVDIDKLIMNEKEKPENEEAYFEE